VAERRKGGEGKEREGKQQRRRGRTWGIRDKGQKGTPLGDGPGQSESRTRADNESFVVQVVIDGIRKQVSYFL
jgi:hypothetical protein